MRKSLEYQGMKRREINSATLENGKFEYERDLEGFDDGYCENQKLLDLIVENKSDKFNY